MYSQPAASAPTLAPPPKHQLNHAEARKLLDSIQIPPQPEIVRALISERAKHDPDVKRIVRLISNDVGLSASVLKAVNSPYYGLRSKISSIQQAVALLGLKNIGTLVMGLALRASAPMEGIERYWESAGRSAELAGLLARKLGLNLVEHAHLYTLFHDSAMPLLLQRLPGYRETMKEMASAAWIGITALEEASHDTNHAVVGGLLASNWGLPETIRNAITLHHDITVFTDNHVPGDVTTLIALGHVAEHVETALSRDLNDCECEAFGESSLSHLLMGQDELQDFIDSARDLFGMDEY